MCLAVVVVVTATYSVVGPRPESALKRGFLSAFGHLARSAPKRAKSAESTPSERSLGHSEPGSQNHLISTLLGTFWPGPLGTPVDDGWDRKVRVPQPLTRAENVYPGKRRDSENVETLAIVVRTLQEKLEILNFAI